MANGNQKSPGANHRLAWRAAITRCSPQLIESVDKGDYIREKVLLQTSEHTLMPVYLLLPKQAQGPLPVVLAFHGHGYGVKDIVGLWEDGQERDTPDGYHKDFAVELCRAGFAVAAPEIACFGERQTDFSYLNPVLGATRADQLHPCRHAGLSSWHFRAGDARPRWDAPGGLPGNPPRSGYQPAGSDGHLGRRDAHLFLDLSR